MKELKLTLKAAKTIALKELGTDKGLTAHENNNSDYQRFEMAMGKHQVSIIKESKYDKPYIYYAGQMTVYDLETLEENYAETDRIRQQLLFESVADAISVSWKFKEKIQSLM